MGRGDRVEELDTELVQGVLSFVSRINKNSKGECIISVPTRVGGEVATFSNTLHLTRDGEVFIYTPSKEKLTITDLSNRILHLMYCYLSANFLVLVSRENLIEHEDAESKMWEVEPIEIKAGEEVIAKIGIAVEETSEAGRLLSAVLISADGTWCTLTMWRDRELESSATAKSDLSIISQNVFSLINYIK